VSAHLPPPQKGEYSILFKTDVEIDMNRNCDEREAEDGIEDIYIKKAFTE
jgi:hypothetical protein